MTSKATQAIIRDLRDTRVLVIHPPDDEAEALTRQLRRIGCRVESTWPPPPEVGAHVDVVFFLIDAASPSYAPRRPGEPTLATVAIAAYEDPTTLKALIDSNAHAVVSKPIRPMGILTNLVLARAIHGYETRLRAKVGKLEETLRAQRTIEKATRILMRARQMTEDEAYQLIRRQAMAKRLSMAVVAHSIINANEVFESLMLPSRQADDLPADVADLRQRRMKRQDPA
ncbi:MAG: ANTAR domain-containing protein [Rhodospirillaceae bacterium]|nr:ANTAR domain-containing protein [Rhodospirillaceae bacterium]